MKAILLNSAKKLPYWHKGKLQKDDDHEAPLDYMQGAGMLNAVGAYRNLIAGQTKPGLSAVASAKADDVPTIGWDNNKLEKNENSQNIYKITVAEPNEGFVTATVVWNKHYDSNYPFEPMPDKDANLRLELWAINPNDPNNNYLLDYSDSKVDNVEHIYARCDANFTHYELIVTYTNSSDSNEIQPDERYGLAWNVSKKQNKNDILLYDLNADGIVNDSDLTILVDNVLTSAKSSKGYFLGDINADGAIDKKDFQILLEHKDTTADWYTTKENTSK
jgi:hypothetical protein